MVSLVRTFRVTGDWRKFWQWVEENGDSVTKKYPEVKSTEMWMNIAGPLNEVHWILQFESLADEEQFALKAMEDEEYFKRMEEVAEFLDPNFGEDRLYRKLSG